jgi:hypothetical protein
MRRSTLIMLSAVVVVGLGIATGLISGFWQPEDDDDEQFPPPTVTVLPPYDATITAIDEIDVVTDAIDPADLRDVFDDVRADRSEGDSWTVTIRCASLQPSDDVDPTLATGRFANTQEGLAETGLESVDDAEFETTGRRDCEPGDPTTPGAVTMEQVLTAIDDAGLPAPNPRDTSRVCRNLGCLERTTTDLFTVMVWPTAEDAEDWADGLILDVILVGPVTTVHFEAAPPAPPFTAGEPTYDRAAFEEALAPLGPIG